MAWYRLARPYAYQGRCKVIFDGTITWTIGTNVDENAITLHPDTVPAPLSGSPDVGDGGDLQVTYLPGEFYYDGIGSDPAVPSGLYKRRRL
jgi:hypothetical protein